MWLLQQNQASSLKSYCSQQNTTKTKYPKSSVSKIIIPFAAQLKVVFVAFSVIIRNQHIAINNFSVSNEAHYLFSILVKTQIKSLVIFIL